MSKFEIAHLARFISLDALHSFARLVKTDPDFTKSHDPEPTRFDKSVTMQFEGMNRRNDGEEEFVFMFLKPGCFALWASLPNMDITFPSITIVGDVVVAKSFLSDLKAHHDAFLLFRQGDT